MKGLLVAAVLGAGLAAQTPPPRPVSLGAAKLAMPFRPPRAASLPAFPLAPRSPAPPSLTARLALSNSTSFAFRFSPFRPWQQPQTNSSPPPQTAAHGSPKHIFWVIPAYNVEYLKNVPPMTPGEKFHEVSESSYDPQGLALSAVEALLEHKASGFCGYGRGWSGYGKCYGAALVDANVSGFVGDYALPVLFHQDPRYFRLGEGASLPGRIWYAFTRVFVCRTDAGGTTFDSSQLLGTAIAGAVSNLYYPRADRGVGLTMSRIGFDLGGTAIFNLEAEFWPDIHRWLKRQF